MIRGILEEKDKLEDRIKDCHAKDIKLIKKEI